jgi:hypothetical protein
VVKSGLMLRNSWKNAWANVLYGIIYPDDDY